MSDFLHQLGHRALGAPSRLRPNAPARLTPVSEAPLETDAFAPTSSEPAASPKPSFAHEPSSVMIERVATGSSSAPDPRVEPANRLSTDQPGGDEGSADADASAGDWTISGDRRPVTTSASALPTAMNDGPSNRPAAKSDRRANASGPRESVRDPVDLIQPAVSSEAVRATRQPPEWVATAQPRLSQPDIAASGVGAIAPEVNIHIGRIELTAVLAQPPARRDPPPMPKTSLDDYLRRRSGRPS
jgi:hypothetical protein